MPSPTNFLTRNLLNKYIILNSAMVVPQIMPALPGRRFAVSQKILMDHCILLHQLHGILHFVNCLISRY